MSTGEDWTTFQLKFTSSNNATSGEHYFLASFPMFK